MHSILKLISDNKLIIAVISSVLTFMFGRYTSYIGDRRIGMKDINESFYKPFLSMYLNEHHAYALYFVDFDYNVQRDIAKILLDNVNRVSPRMKRKIWNLDQCLLDYSKDFEDEVELSSEDKVYVERCFNEIYEYIQKQYIKNERKLYCAFSKRVKYVIEEFLVSHNILKD